MSLYHFLRNHILKSTLSVILLLGLLINLGVITLFNQYYFQQITQEDLRIIDNIEGLLIDGDFNTANLLLLSTSSSRYIKVYDGSQNLIFDTASAFETKGLNRNGNGMGHGMMNNSLSNTFDTYKANDFTFETYTTTNMDYDISIGHLQTIFSNERAKVFILSLNALILVTVIIAVLVAVGSSKKIAQSTSEKLIGLQNNLQSIENNRNAELKPLDHQIEEFERLNATIHNLQESLLKEEYLRKQMTVDIAHELRNPLAIIRSHIEAFVDGVWEPTPEKLGNCENEIMRLTRLIDELNDLSQIEAKSQLHKDKMSLSKTLLSQAQIYQKVADDKSITLVTSIEDNITLVADYMRIEQLVSNLLSNAIKYTPTGGQIEIASKETPNQIYFSISDNGEGISKEDLPHIFERFYRIDRSRSRKTGGLGIGLAIVKGICDSHGFTLKVESNLNIGTTFTIVIDKAFD